MENFKFILLSIIALAIIGFLGYWAIFTIQPGNIYVEKQKQKELTQKNQELTKEVEDLKNQLAAVQSPEQAKSENTTPTTTNSQKTTNITPSKYQDLMNALQKLVDNNVSMKLKSSGTSVGTVQTFLNIYNNTSKRVDNDYGSSTKTDIINFQTAVGLTADGQAGPSTFQKMIDWLKKQ